MRLCIYFSDINEQEQPQLSHKCRSRRVNYFNFARKEVHEVRLVTCDSRHSPSLDTFPTCLLSPVWPDSSCENLPSFLVLTRPELQYARVVCLSLRSPTHQTCKQCWTMFESRYYGFLQIINRVFANPHKVFKICLTKVDTHFEQSLLTDEWATIGLPSPDNKLSLLNFLIK